MRVVPLWLLRAALLRVAPLWLLRAALLRVAPLWLLQAALLRALPVVLNGNPRLVVCLQGRALLLWARWWAPGLLPPGRLRAAPL